MKVGDLEGYFCRHKYLLDLLKRKLRKPVKGLVGMSQGVKGYGICVCQGVKGSVTGCVKGGGVKKRSRSQPEEACGSRKEQEDILSLKPNRINLVSIITCICAVRSPQCTAYSPQPYIMSCHVFTQGLTRPGPDSIRPDGPGNAPSGASSLSPTTDQDGYNNNAWLHYPDSESINYLLTNIP